MTQKNTLPLLIASDIGGTLVRGTPPIPPFTSYVLNHLVKKGVPVALITGFNYHSTQKYTRDLDDNILLMPQNGSLCIKKGKLVWEYRFEPPQAQKLHDFLYENQLPIIAYKGKEENFSNFYVAPEPLPLSPVFSRIDHFENFENITGISTLLPDPMALQLREKIQAIAGKHFQVIYTREVKGSWLEVVHRDVRKDLALTRLCHELHIPLTQVIYFGDNFNDREALRLVGKPVLVANAQPELQAEFPFIIAPVTEEGVAHYLNDLFQLHL